MRRLFSSTDHHLALGNIESARGRIVRRSGEYAKALEHFERAVAIYSQGDPNHRNIARTLVNAAHVKRLLALQLHRKIDAQARKQSQTKAGTPPRSSQTIQGNLRVRYQQLCNEAMSQLRRAKEIYSLHGHSSGLGAVLFNEGYLFLDRGEIDAAAVAAGDAYRIGVEKSDHILMARARILQASAENARVEEQLGEDVDTALHATEAIAIDGPETGRLTVEPCSGDPGMQCLSPEQIARFVLDAAEEDELENMIRHVRHCSPAAAPGQDHG